MMLKSLRAALILTLFCSPAFADYLRIIPPAPDSNDLIVAEMGGRWRDSCVPRNPDVVRNGNVISVFLEVAGGVCLPAVTQWDESVALGALEPGAYTLVVNINDAQVLAPPVHFMTLRFPVTDAEARHTIAPNVGPASGGTEVTILGSFGSCPIAPPCSDPQVIFGGAPALSVRQIAGGVIAVTPPHAPGVVDVELRGLAGTTVATLPAAFTFHESGTLDPSAYTPVLFPLIFSGPGAFNSEFVTEATFYNESQVAITPLNQAAVTTCPPNVSPCPAPPFAGSAWDSFHHGASYPTGLLLWIPRSQANDINFSLHVRDVSRAAEGAGTNIPVIREEELFDGEVHLLNIPVTPGFRHTIRIYDLALEADSTVSVTAFSPQNERIDSRSVTLTRAGDPCVLPEGCVPDIPMSAVLSGFVTADAGSDRIRLVISSSDPGSRLWAFVSITNNTTQQITTVTPE